MKPMTRTMLFRVLLGMKMLAHGDWTAYWWLMPRRLKRCANYSAFVRAQMFRAMIEGHRKFFLETMQKRFVFDGPTTFAPLSRYEYRLPISFR